MLPNNGKPQANPNRRYSLFNSSRSATSYQASLANIFSSNNDCNKRNDLNTKENIIRRNTSDMSNSACQRCKRLEIELTNASDNLNATDAELKASRQVISLLQRQLELFQVEKDGLEKLIISQSKSPLQQIATLSNSSTSKDQEDILKLDDTTSAEKYEINGDPNDMQKKLLRLIQTQLYAKDEEIVKLKSSLKESQNQKEQLNLQLHMLEDDISKLKVENSLLNENLSLRDQTIVSLSNEVFEQGNVNDFHLIQRRQSTIEALPNQRSSIKAQRHIAKLIDTLDAYKKTNELLSANVMRLTDRCAQAEKKEIETRSECQELEAKCCQIQSKLLSLLKEIEQSSKQSSDDDKTDQDQEVICSESVKLLIKRLLEDKSLDIPLSWKDGNKSRTKRNNDKNKSSECDELGFYISTNDENFLGGCSTSSSNTSGSQSKLQSAYLSHLVPVEEVVETNEHDSAKNSQGEVVDRLRQHSVDATKSDENDWRLRWDEFIKDFDKIELDKSKEFKRLLRSGVPQEYRCKVWKALVGIKIGADRQNHGADYYQSLVEPGRPQSGLKKSLNPSSKQIELDLLRTLPNNKYFESIDSPGTVRLRRVLTAYSAHNPQVGYCQGMNRLAAVALLVLPEEEAFWCLVAIVDKIMPIGYYNDLWLAQVDSNVVMEFVAIKMSSLNEHFKKEGIELSLFAWFLTIFVDGTPPALFLRLWDCFLYEGDKIMFRVALALLKMYETELLKMSSSVAVNNFLRSVVNAPMNIDRFFEIAFELINPLRGRELRTKRQQNFKTLKSGFKNVRDSNVSPINENSFPVERDDSKEEKDYDTPNEDSSIISI